MCPWWSYFRYLVDYFRHLVDCFWDLVDYLWYLVDHIRAWCATVCGAYGRFQGLLLPPPVLRARPFWGARKDAGGQA